MANDLARFSPTVSNNDDNKNNNEGARGGKQYFDVRVKSRREGWGARVLFRTTRARDE
jgi:hypothetical protein